MPHFRVAPRLCFKLRLSAKPWIWRFNNNYWMRLSKILWFVNQRLRQIIDLRDTDKSPYFASSIIIVSTFNHRVCFLMDHFHARVIARRRKKWLPLRMSRILYAAKQSWTTLHMSSRGGLLANERKDIFAMNDNIFLFSCK